MKLIQLTSAAAALALLGGAASAQQAQQAPTPGSVTGDWNGAHAPSDDKQYQEKVRVPVGAPPSDSSAAAPMPESSSSATSSTSATVSSDATASSATSAATPAASVTTTMVTNGPVPDTPENRAKYGQPMSRAGKMTAARGN